MKFEEAMVLLRKGSKIARKAWTDNSALMLMKELTPNGKTYQVCVYLDEAGVPNGISFHHPDANYMLAEDWYELIYPSIT